MDTHPQLPSPAPRVDPTPPALAPARGLVELFLEALNPNTLAAYRRDLDEFAAFVRAPTSSLAVDGLVRLGQGEAHAVALSYRSHLVARELAPATIARRLSSLRSVAKLARQLGLCAWHLEIRAPRVQAYRDTRGPGDAGWKALVSAAKERRGPGPARDLAILRLLHDCALRRFEVVGLDVDHLDLAGDPPSASIRGKGRTGRERVTLPGPTAAAVADWLAFRGSAPGPVFVPLDGARGASSPITTLSGPAPQRLTGRSVARIVNRLGSSAGLARRARPHGLRHQAITRVLDLTAGDVRAAQRFARHASPATTMRYDDNRQDLAGQLARRLAED